MKREEKILLAVFAAVLLCGLGAALFLSAREPSAKIQFNQASLSTNGRLILDYSFIEAGRSYQREIESIDGHRTTISQGGGASWLWFPGHGAARTERSITRWGATAAALPVKTGVIYNVTPGNPLILYDFTNSDGVHYESEYRIDRRP